MIEIKRTCAKTRVNLLAVVGRDVVDYTLLVYGVTPESENFREEVIVELGMVSSGRAELYKIIDARVVGTATMIMPGNVFKEHATIINHKDGSVTMNMDARTFEAFARIICNDE